jgi:choline kinase
MARAILLAAGRGRRLGIDGPKCLLPISGRSLLERHIENLEAAGVTQLTVVTGHAAELLDAELDAIRSKRSKAGRELRLEVSTLFNERFVHGSLVSLQCAGDVLASGSLYMDADVLYPAEMLSRLLGSEHGNCCLLDARSSEQGEEMMLGVSDGQVRRIARSVGTQWDLVGESVGFFKVDADGGEKLRAVLDAEVAAGRLDQEHEDGLDATLSLAPFGFERVDDLPWTEIDFPEDIERAEQLVSEIARAVG